METLNLIKNDPWLEPFEDAIKGRQLCSSGNQQKVSFA